MMHNTRISNIHTVNTEKINKGLDGKEAYSLPQDITVNT